VYQKAAFNHIYADIWWPDNDG